MADTPPEPAAAPQQRVQGRLQGTSSGWRKVQLLQRGNTRARARAPPPPADLDEAAAAGAPDSSSTESAAEGPPSASLVTRLTQRMEHGQQEVEDARSEAVVWRRERQELERRLEVERWRRWELDDKTRLEMRVEELGRLIQAAETTLPRQHERRCHLANTLMQSLQRLGALDDSGNLDQHSTGGSKTALSVRHADARAPGQGPPPRRTKAPEEEGAVAREARLSAELLDTTVAHMFGSREGALIMANGRVCPRCCHDLVSTPLQQLLCPRCKIFMDANVLASASSIMDSSDSSALRRRSSGGQYFSAEHFMTRLQNVQGHFHRIPPKVMKDVCMYIWEYSIPEHDWTNIWVIRECLAGVGKPKLYDHAPLISTYISGIQPPQLSAVTVSEISTMIKMLHKAWAAMQRVLDEEQANANMLAGRPVKPTNRNHPNAGLCLQHLGLLLGIDPLLKYNWSIWEVNNVRTKQAMMKTAFGEYGWEMTTVDTPRQAGPAKGAVGRRVVACTLAKMTLSSHDWRVITPQERAQAHPLRRVRRRQVPLKTDATRSRTVTECRGVNFQLARRLRRLKRWQAVEDVTYWVTFWDMLLSDFNPWEQCRTKIAEARRTVEEWGVAYIADYLREMEDNELRRQTTPSLRRATTASVLKRTTARAKQRAQRIIPAEVMAQQQRQRELARAARHKRRRVRGSRRRQKQAASLSPRTGKKRGKKRKRKRTDDDGLGKQRP